MEALAKLHIIPGKNCNLECSHCVNFSGPGAGSNLTETEIADLIGLINRSPIEELLFTGGEPTLYIQTINKILNGCENLAEINVIITTNGKYAVSELAVFKVLSRVKKISHIQLSYDTFHGSDQTPEKARVLEKYCAQNGISFSVSVCISNPSQLLQIAPLSECLDADITFQKVEASGRAKAEGTQYEYFEFSPNVLKMTCPNLEMVTYIPSKGYTNCCSNLVFNGEDTNSYCKPNVDSYFNSEFYQNIKSKTFGDLLADRGINAGGLESKYSSPCSLCEDLHRGRLKCST